jgi:hypothetical protein
LAGGCGGPKSRDTSTIEGIADARRHGQGASSMGGARVFVDHAAAALRRRGWEVEVVDLGPATSGPMFRWKQRPLSPPG